MEFVIVKFPEARQVMNAGNPGGNTGVPFRVAAGPHTFSLSDPQNYSPPQQQIDVEDTTPDDPMEVIFTLNTQFVIVRLPETRQVILDGTPCGDTGVPLQIAAGPHIFTLSGPQNYSPPRQAIHVADTDPGNPMEVVFALN
jgi:hypothetical protein